MSKPEAPGTGTSSEPGVAAALDRRAFVRRVALGAGVGGGVGGCSREKAGSPGEAVARQFVDAHYVEIDKPSALLLTIGPAHDQVQREIDETKGQTIAPDTRLPEVKYHLNQARAVESGGMTFLFDATIQVPSGGKLGKEFWVTTQETPEGWKVVSFSDRESAPADGARPGGGG